MKRPFSREDAEQVFNWGGYEGIPIEIIQKLGDHDGGYFHAPSPLECKIEMLRLANETQKERTTLPKQISRLLENPRDLAIREGENIRALVGFQQIANELETYYKESEPLDPRYLQKIFIYGDGKKYSLKSIQEYVKNARGERKLSRQ
jgi:hypothetical protein